MGSVHESSGIVETLVAPSAGERFVAVGKKSLSTRVAALSVNVDVLGDVPTIVTVQIPLMAFRSAARSVNGV